MNGIELGRKLRNQEEIAVKKSAETQSNLSSSSRELENIRIRLASLYGQLAEMRIGSLQEGDVQAITRAGIQAKDALDKRTNYLLGKQQELQLAIKEIPSLEKAILLASACEENAQAELDSAQQSSDTKLDADQVFQDLYSDTVRKEQIAHNAIGKANRANDELSEKRKSYEADKLFMYLWSRKFGTAEYEANALTSRLDHWVSKLIDFPKARMQFELLNKLPDFLGKRADELSDELLASQEKSTEYRLTHEKSQGLPALRQQLDNAVADLERVELAHQELMDQISDIQDQLSAADKGRDESLNLIQDNLAKQLRGYTLAQLRTMALQTDCSKDDELVEEIESTLASERKLSEEVSLLEDAHSQATAQAERAKAAFQAFRKKGYDSSRWRFSNFDDGLILGYIAGNATHGTFMSQLSSNGHRTSPGSSYSSDSSFSSSSGFGGGGFSSGGGFGGGGGFSTGGGF